MRSTPLLFATLLGDVYALKMLVKRRVGANVLTEGPIPLGKVSLTMKPTSNR